MAIRAVSRAGGADFTPVNVVAYPKLSDIRNPEE